MNIAYASDGSTGGGFSMFVPLLLLLIPGVVYAFILRSIAKRKGRSQPRWFLAAFVPFWNIMGGIWLASLPEKPIHPTWKCTCGITNTNDLPNCPECGVKRDYVLARLPKVNLH